LEWELDKLLLGRWIVGDYLLLLLPYQVRELQYLLGFELMHFACFVELFISFHHRIGLVCSALVLFVKDPKRGAKEAAFLERRECHLTLEPSTLSESERRTLQNSEYVTSLESNKALALCGMSRQVVPASPVMSSPDRFAVKDGAVITQNSGDNNLPLSERSYLSSNSTWKLLKVPSVVLTILQAAPGALPFGFCATFLNDFLQEQRGMSKEVST